MTSYITITEAQTDPEAPLTSELAKQWRDNPIAITEGAAGAPRIQDAALSTTVTDTGRAWVNNRLGYFAFGSAGPKIEFAALNSWYTTAGGVGTYVFARSTGVVDVAYGATVAGSTLAPVSAAYRISGAPTDGSLASGAVLSGTWRCMGNYDYTVFSSPGTMYGATLWVRIS